MPHSLSKSRLSVERPATWVNRDQYDTPRKKPRNQRIRGKESSRRTALARASQHAEPLWPRANEHRNRIVSSIQCQSAHRPAPGLQRGISWTRSTRSMRTHTRIAGRLHCACVAHSVGCTSQAARKHHIVPLQRVGLPRGISWTNAKYVNAHPHPYTDRTLPGLHVLEAWNSSSSMLGMPTHTHTAERLHCACGAHSSGVLARRLASTTHRPRQELYHTNGS
ncbi:hypothetical protein B0H14DRAFT_1402153 [Mycena olivaceomarginata]|nr:hypothetical protein B0H14DRAFT_1402153 [Mycena olivaceomarginata]